MKTNTCFPNIRRNQPKLALVVAGAMLVVSAPLAAAYDTPNKNYNNMNNYSYSNNQRDPSYGWSNTVSDCVHGSTGISNNMDCSRNHASRHVNDLSGNMTDTGYIDGNVYAHSDANRY